MSIVGPQRLALRGWGTADPIFLSTAQVHVPQVFVMVPSGLSGMLPLSHQKSSATADQLSYKTLKRKKILKCHYWQYMRILRLVACRSTKSRDQRASFGSGPAKMLSVIITTDIY
jgi:hypothetical protein